MCLPFQHERALAESTALLLQLLFAANKTVEEGILGLTKAWRSYTCRRVCVGNMHGVLTCTCSLSEPSSDPELPTLNIYKVPFIRMKANASVLPCWAYGSSMKSKINGAACFQLDLMPAIIIFNQMESSLGDTKPSNIGKIILSVLIFWCYFYNSFPWSLLKCNLLSFPPFSNKSESIAKCN